LRLARDEDIHGFLKNAEDQLGCDLTHVSAARRVSGGAKGKPDLLLMYWVWLSGLLTNAQVGNLFGLTYTAVSHNITEIKKKLRTYSRASPVNTKNPIKNLRHIKLR
jgi:hypothetical protein